MEDHRDDWKSAAMRVADGIRRIAFELAVEHEGGYLIQACSSAEILATLYVRLMNLGPSSAPPLPAPFTGVPGSSPRSRWGGGWNGPDDPAWDRFVLSPTHYSTALYATLVETDRLSSEALEEYGKDGSVLEMIGAEHSPGVEVTGGSLGQALSVAVGRALARKQRGNQGHIWVLISDGETQEGQTWEALQSAAAFGLDNLTVMVDANRWQVDGPMDRVMPVGSLCAKAIAFGCSAVEVDGHDVSAIADAATSAEPGRPRVIVCATHPWTGFPGLRRRDDASVHFVRFGPGEADMIRASSQLFERTQP